MARPESDDPEIPASAACETLRLRAADSTWLAPAATSAASAYYDSAAARHHGPVFESVSPARRIVEYCRGNISFAGRFDPGPTDLVRVPEAYRYRDRGGHPGR